MFFNQSRAPIYPCNQDKVLQQFYQQRKKRSRNSSKRHSLLEKNSSYFSNSNYVNMSQNMTHSTQNNEQTPSSHYSSFNTTTNFTNNQNNINGNTETKTPVAVRNHIRQRSISITQAQILKKYQDGNHSRMVKNPHEYSLGTTAPISPTATTNGNKIKINTAINSGNKITSKDQSISSSVKDKHRQNNPTKTGSTKIEENKYLNGGSNCTSLNGQLKNNQRRRNLQKLQNNFKILTGQLPAYHGEYYENLSRNKDQLHKNNQNMEKNAIKIENHNVSTNMTRSHQNITKKQKISYLQMNKSTDVKISNVSTPKNSITQCVRGNDNITVINKIKSNKKPESSSTPPLYPSTTANSKLKPTKVQNHPQSHANLINIRQYLANNSSFCANKQPSYKIDGNEYQRNQNNKFEQEQPLLVLAANPKKQKSQQKQKRGQEKERQNTLKQIYQKYNITENKKLKPCLQTNKTHTNEQEQQYSEYQENNEILIEQSCQNSHEMSPVEISQNQEFQSPNFKMCVDNTNKNCQNKYQNRVNTHESGSYSFINQLPNKDLYSQKQNLNKTALLKNYDHLNKNTDKDKKNAVDKVKYLNVGSLNNSRASKASNGNKTNKKNTTSLPQTKISSIQTEQKIKRTVQSSLDNMRQIQKENQDKAKQSLSQYYQAQILKLQNKVVQLQKTNKKQKKFIESVYSMRRTIQKCQDDCNLKELWRWLKDLPNKM